MNPSLLTLFVFVIYSADVIGVWWSHETALYLDKNGICRRTQNLFHRGRTDFCRAHAKVVEMVLEGVALSVEECQYQFRHRRWNCSTTKTSIRRIVRSDYRETAFIFAITSAGITFSVTRACSNGDLSFCSCNTGPGEHSTNLLRARQSNNNHARMRQVDNRRVSRTTNQRPSETETLGEDGKNKRFEWSGCNDNIIYGSKISKEFMNGAGNNGDIRFLIQRHNNQAGRLAVEKNMKTECKCVGLSGSCSVKTCWKKMPHFRYVSEQLRYRFDGASKVILSNNGDALLTEGHTIKPPTQRDLVYTTDSPSFCRFDAHTGSLGTTGRQCNKTSKALEGCDLLCCGRPSIRRKVVVNENCNCRFKWCCEVICQECKMDKTIFTCT